MEIASVININTDKPCSKCGVLGALENGLCMKCAFERYHNKIGSKTIEAIRDQVEQMLRTYTLNLNDAYKKMDDLKISFAVEIGPGTGGDLIVTTKMNFIESRVKDEIAGDAMVKLIIETPGGMVTCENCKLRERCKHARAEADEAKRKEVRHGAVDRQRVRGNLFERIGDGD